MYQKITVVGNLGRDPEMRYMQDGTAVTNFSIACNRRWTTADGQPGEETIWFRVEVWRRQAETVNQYLSRGSKVLVEGRIKPDPKTGNPRMFNRSDGSIGCTFEIVADQVRFLDKVSERQNGNGHANGNGVAQPAAAGPAVEEDEIPF